MPIHIDEIQTDVQVEDRPSSAAAPAPEPPWQQLAVLRRTLQQLLCDEARTLARGNED